MSNNRDIISRVRSNFKWLSSDNSISDRAILAELRSTASLLIKRETDRRKLLQTDTLYTTVPCVEMVEVSLAECCSYTSPCTIRRSKYKIPKVGEGIWGNLVQGVYSVDGKATFMQSDPNRFANSLKLGLKTKPKFYWIQNNYLYISDSFIELVMIKAYFEEDINPELFACSADPAITECTNPLDTEFKCPTYLVENIITVVSQKYNATYRTAVPDITSDDLDQSK